MKSGFYVSNCGKHIIQIEYKMNIHTHRCTVDFDGSHMNVCSFSSELITQLEIILCGWIYLGQL